MPSALSLGGRIATNLPAELAYNSQLTNSRQLAESQLRISTGKRINQAADDVSGYITSRALEGRNSSLTTALISAGEAINLTAIAQDSYSNIHSLLSSIRDSAVTASASSLGTDEVVALAKGAYRLAQQIQSVVDSTVFGGRQIISGNFSGDWVVGYNANSETLKVGINLSYDNSDFNISNSFIVNAISNTRIDNDSGLKVEDVFAGVLGLSLNSLSSINANDLGIFSNENVKTTIVSLSNALTNITKVNSYVGGVQSRLNSQNDALLSQIVNYKSAISRINDADVAEEQLKISKSQFLNESSLFTLAQANLNPSFMINLLL